jgi:hypothetical protein
MSLRRLFDRFFGPFFGGLFTRREHAFDKIQIVDAVTDAKTEGRKAVAAYFKQEKELYEAHGASITFQVYRIDIDAPTIEGFQGERLDEIKIDSGFVSGADTVAMVKQKLRTMLVENGRLHAHTDKVDQFTLWFAGRAMQDDKLFYADHYVLLPTWVQLLLHGCSSERFVERLADLSKRRPNPPVQPTDSTGG